MNVLLTGMTGLLGFNILRYLIKTDYKIIVLVRDPNHAMSLIARYLPDVKNIKIVKGDLTDKDSLIQATREVDCIINSAAVIGLRGESYKEQKRVNTDGVQNLFEAGLQNKVKRFIQITSIETLKTGSLKNPADESEQYWFRNSSDPYVQSKVAAERLILNYKDSGMEIVFLHPGMIIGPYDLKPATGAMILKALQGLTFVYSRGAISVSDAETIAEATVNAITMARSGERYLLSGENLPFKKVYQIIHEIAGSVRGWIPLPNWVFRIVAFFLKWIENIFKINPFINSHRTKILTLDQSFSCEKAKKELGYKGSDAYMAFKKAYDWMKENHYIK